jgi:hypothetical protein
MRQRERSATGAAGCLLLLFMLFTYAFYLAFILGIAYGLFWIADHFGVI